MRQKIVLACNVCKSRNYTTEKNKEANSLRVEMKKFCGVCNTHTIHLETK